MLNYVGVLFALLFLATACGGGKSVEPTIIPSDVSVVMSIDFKSMSSKATEWKDLFNTEFLKTADLDDKDADVIAKLLGSGIDLNKTGYFFLRVDKDTKKSYVAAVMGLKDAKQFEEGLKKATEKFKISKKGERSYAVNEGEGIISWDKSSMLLTTTPENDDQKTLEALHEQILKTSKNNSLEAKNSDFKKFLGTTHDIGVWVDYKKVSDAATEADAFVDIPPSLQDLTKLTENLSFILNFEKGKVVIDAQSKIDAKIMEKYADLFKGKMDANLVSSTPVLSPIMMLGFGIGMKGVKKLLEEAGTLKEVNETASQVGLSVDELFAMLSGDLVIALESANVENIFNPDIQGTVGLGIAKKETLQKLLNKFDGLPFLKKKDNYYVIRAEGQQYFLIEKDDMLFLASNEKIRDNIAKGKGKLDDKVAKIVKDKLSCMYVDFQKLFKSLPKGTFDDPIIEKEVLPKFISLEIYSNEYEGNTSKGKITLNMSEKNRNALAILVEIAKKTSKKGKTSKPNA